MSQMADSDHQQREWLYHDGTNQKGPISSTLVIRLLERGIISPTTMIWKAGMESWQSLINVDTFKDIAVFQSKQWYYVDNEAGQKGPISTRLLTEKIKNGDIDGLTMMYSDDTNGWKKISEIPSLRDMMMKIVAEEEAVNEALNAVKTNSQDPQQLFVFEQDVIPDIPEEMKKKSAAKAAINHIEGKKRFTTDDGKRYKWDDDEQDWVEDSDAESDDEEDDDNDDDDSDDGHSDDEDKQSKRKKGNPAASSSTSAPVATAADGNQAAKKKKKKKRVKKGPNTWVYVTGLPSDISEDEMKAHFSKVGLIALNPLDQTPRVKIYRDENGSCKGDGVLCYNAAESVALAVDILNGGYIRPKYMITVTQADFASKELSDRKDNATGESENSNDPATKKRPRPTATNTQRKIAQSAMKQALAWNEEDDFGLTSVKALRIIVLEGMFKPDDFINDPTFGDDLEQDIAMECSKFGELDKITVFSKHPSGIVIIKFKTSFAAQECIKSMDGRYFGGSKLKCHYWDGVTNYSLSNDVHARDIEEKREKERLDEFGDWLEKEQDNLPSELRLRVEE